MRLSVECANRLMKSWHEGKLLTESPQKTFIYPIGVHPMNQSGQIVCRIIQEPGPSKDVHPAVALQQVSVGF